MGVEECKGDADWTTGCIEACLNATVRYAEGRWEHVGLGFKMFYGPRLKVT